MELEEEQLKSTQIDNDKLSKAELLKKLTSVEKAHMHLLKEYEYTQNQLKNGMQAYHNNIENRMQEQDKLLAYYERKFKLLKDLLTIEEGDN